MNNNYLDTIFDLTKSEKNYIANPLFHSPVYQKMSRVSIDGTSVYKFELPNLKKNIIEIRRDSRFTAVPAYIHSNININYVYSGTCNYTVNDEKILLTKGDICIVDRNVIRSKEKLTENDIVINISLSNDFFSREFIMGLGEASVLTIFLFSAITQNNHHDGYLFFRNSDATIESYFSQLITEYFKNDSFSRHSIEALFSLIFIQLIRNYQENEDKQIVHISSSNANNLLKIIEYIEKHSEVCTLEETAQIFNYHPKYLSQLIKRTFGKSFKEIQTDQRLRNAAQYLEFSEQAISEIANLVGMSNITQFYKKFQIKYGITPAEYRNKQTIRPEK
ncbi:helix-turn-helix transcriptional regulator [Listeria sp. FSL L7-1509]|uniref:Helix-turn-helix transcriptional regulator n=1 Tax=Listeria immobilis TaxID=2713502 RepID=A0ABR6SYH3_9LIST|nr:helix-turn-helix domain-containing protein [Listeria immobilis]MBC1507701.1 helix-turn-helix transcriptional regulator [Listeria immobilis]MBC1510738.1 helix-turn-helix transcriptional regulator [Listeria immobilis]MBC6296684.1 helix-turn-helix transcriptional regulator [Listeria immobilis]MBC6313255.1 helix-turn-helix transcriptional regulator [Listeria immobilis]